MTVDTRSLTRVFLASPGNHIEIPLRKRNKLNLGIWNFLNSVFYGRNMRDFLEHYAPLSPTSFSFSALTIQSFIGLHFSINDPVSANSLMTMWDWNLNTLNFCPDLLFTFHTDNLSTCRFVSSCNLHGISTQEVTGFTEYLENVRNSYSSERANVTQSHFIIVLQSGIKRNCNMYPRVWEHGDSIVGWSTIL